MSGPEWVIVSAIAVVLILLFVTLEWLFPIGDPGSLDGGDRAGDGEKAAGSPVAR